MKEKTEDGGMGTAMAWLMAALWFAKVTEWAPLSWWDVVWPAVLFMPLAVAIALLALLVKVVIR